SRGIEVDELEINHLGCVAGSVAELDDPGVAARSVGHPRPDVVEQLVHHLLGAEHGERLTARVKVATPAERDHLLGEGLDGLRLRLGRPDPAVLDERARQVGVQRLAVRRIAAELLPCASVAHGYPCSGNPPEPFSPRRWRPCCASVSRTSSIDFLPKFGIAASSCSVFITRSPMVSIPTRLRQLYERTPSSSSSIGKFSIPCASAASGETPPPSTGAASPKPSIRSRSVKIASCRIRISAASASASFGSTEPSVVMSSVSL